MAIDPAFKLFPLEQSWRPAYFINTKGTFDDGYFADEAPAGAAFGGSLITCTVHGFNITDPPRDLSWYVGDQGTGSLSLSLRDAMDLALAEHPDTEYFAIWVNMNIATTPGIGTCGNPVDGLLFVYNGPGDVINNPAHGWIVHDSFGESGWTLDGTDVQIATPVPPGSADNPGPDFDRWYVDDFYFDFGAGGLGEFESALDTTIPHGYLLRPTALTWSGQDAANHANRILWTTAEVDEVAHAWEAATGLVEVFPGNAGYIVRPYKLAHPDSGIRHPGSVSAAPGQRGRRNSGRVIGKGLEGTTLLGDSWESGGSSGMLTTGDITRGIVR